MKTKLQCKAVLTLLDQFQGGQLSEQKKQALENHLAGCAGCRTAWQEEQAWKTRLASLPREVPPAENLWAGIAARLPAPSKEQSRFRPGLIIPFAAAFFLVGLLFGLTVTLPRRGSSRGPQTAEAGLLEEFHLAAWQYDAARKNLYKSLQEVSHLLDKKTIAVITQNIELIDCSIEAIRTTLVENPSNRQNVLKLAELYQEETHYFEKTTLRLKDFP